MDNKRRRYFVLYDKEDCYIGRGTYYEEGNVQVYMEESGKEAWQMRLADALMLDGVESFCWVDEEPVVVEPLKPSKEMQAVQQTMEAFEAEVARNLGWNRIDGAYDPKEFEDE